MTRATRAGGLPGQRDPAHPGHLHEQVHGGRHLLPLRHAAVRAQVRLLDHRGDQGECCVVVIIVDACNRNDYDYPSQTVPHLPPAAVTW